MPTYFVASTELEQTAEVEAPTPRKARTTFLDYLERGDEIDRNQRQMIRETMATKKVRPGSTGADIRLDYDMRDGHVPFSPEPVQRFERFEEVEEDVEFTPRSSPTAAPPPTASPAIREPRVHRPELYETRQFRRVEPLPRPQMQRQVQVARPAPPRMVVGTSGYTPQREVPMMMGSPIARVARTAVAPRRGL